MVDFIHIGLNKTGTTFLQNGLFASHPQLQVFGSSLFPSLNNKQLFSIVSYLNNCSSLFFDDQYFSTYIESMIQAEKQSNRIVGISSEGLSGGWRDGKSVKFVAQKLKEHFGNVKVIICLREQFSMLDSNYNQFLKRGGTVSFQECFFSPHFGGGMLHPDEINATNVTAYFQYSFLISEYIRLFGRKNIKVIFYEDLKLNPDSFQKEICNFLGIDETIPEYANHIEKNIRLTTSSLSLLMLFNRFFNTKFNPKRGKMSFVGKYLFSRMRDKFNFKSDIEKNPYLLYLEFHKRLQRKLVKILQYKIDPLISSQHKIAPDYISTIDDDKKFYLKNIYQTDNDRLCKILDISPAELRAKGYLVSN